MNAGTKPILYVTTTESLQNLVTAAGIAIREYSDKLAMYRDITPDMTRAEILVVLDRFISIKLCAKGRAL